MCPYVGGKPTDFITPATYRAAEDFARKSADAGGKFMTERTRARTPKKTGLSRDSILQSPVHRSFGVGGFGAVAVYYASGPFSAYENVRRLEYGTKPHEIRPRPGKKALAIPFMTPTGRVKQGAGAGITYAARVHHPGTRGVHMFAIAAAETEVAIPQLVERPMREWKRDTERAIIRNRRR